jgi:hypothetical protein
MSMRKCDGCDRRNFEPAPVLHDEVWLKLADERELLCSDCMWRRQRERHVSITINSLKPCPVNLANPWFDLFAQLVNAPPDNIADWRASAREPWVLFRRDGQFHPWLIDADEAHRIMRACSQSLDEQWRHDQEAKERACDSSD